MTVMPITLPFSIGDALWLPRTNPQKVTLPCPACKGERVVTVIYGGDERVQVDCEACGLGFNNSRGIVEEYDLTPAAEPFVIVAVDSLYDDKWRVRSTAGHVTDFHLLRATEAEALADSTRLCEAQHERNMQSRQHKRKSMARATWSIKYHRDNIKDLERQISWHTARINAKRVTP